MSNVYVYSSDPGLEVLLGRGAVLNAISELRTSPRYASGLTTLGIVGSVVNDRGAPGVPVLLEGGAGDLLKKYGAFDPDLGEGAADGYNGNCAALCEGLDAARMVLCPVDLAIKTATIATGVDLEVTLSRSFSITGENSNDLITTTVAHGLAVGDRVTFSGLAGGTGLSAATYYVVSVPSATTFAVAATKNGDVVDITVDYSAGTMVPADAYTLPAGTQIEQAAASFSITGVAATDVITTDSAHGLVVGDTVTVAVSGGGATQTWGTHTVAMVPSTTTLTLTGVNFTTDITVGTLTRAAGGYVVATLEDVYWAAGVSTATGVRCRQVSGTPRLLSSITTLDTSSKGVRVTTTSTTVPDDVDAAELLLRYEAMLDAINETDLGASIDVLITDRTEAAICDALGTHVDDSNTSGVFRVGVVSPPMGTSNEDARTSSGDGVGRTTLSRANVIYVHPGVKRRFPKDADNLSAPDYLATFPAHALFAACVCAVRPEQNPAEESKAIEQIVKRYGVAGIEQSEGGSEHWAAGIVTPKIAKRPTGTSVFFRDGIMADGTEVATKRTEQWLLNGAFDRVRPFHKTVASASNREACIDSVRTWLQSLLDAERIAAFVVSGDWDAPNRHLVVEVAVQEVGTLNVITLKLSVGPDSVSVQGAGQEAA